MIEHYVTHVFPNRFKAQVVAVSRLAAIMYKKALENALKQKINDLINELFKKYKIEDWRKNIEECIDLLVDEEIRNEFIMLVREFNRAMDAVLPDPEALKYATELKNINFIKESARNRYRDDKLNIKDASRKIREIVEEYLISKGVDPKIPPTPLLDDTFISKIQNKSSRARAEELSSAILEYIERHYEEDPEFYERFSDKLNSILEGYKNNWEALAAGLEQLRNEIKRGREAEETFGFEPKTEIPFLGVLNQEIFDKKQFNELSNEEIDFLVDLARDKEIQVVDFLENYTKQKKLRTYIISHLLDKLTNKRNTDEIAVGDVKMPLWWARKKISF